MECIKTEISFDMHAKRPLLKQQYRTPLAILSDVLQIIMDAGMQGVMVSELSRRANLSYNATVENCQRLTDACLIQSARRGRNYIFVITTKGIEFFREFKKFQEIVQEMKLRY